MRRVLPCAVVLAAFIAVLAAQSVQQAILAVRVEPQAALNVTAAPLRFTIPKGGAGEVAGGTITLLAKARPGPGQRVRLTVSAAGGIAGPSAVIPASEVRWTGARVAARGGASAAVCTSGTLAGAAPRDLAANWNRGGVLTCSVTFSLPAAARFPPGVYTGSVYFDLGFD